MSDPYYEYQQINISIVRDTEGAPFMEVHEIANKYAAEGWRTVAFIPAKAAAYSECLLLERVVHPVDTVTGSIADPTLTQRERDFRYGDDR